MVPSTHKNNIGQQIHCIESRATVIGECKLRDDDGNWDMSDAHLAHHSHRKESNSTPTNIYKC